MIVNVLCTGEGDGQCQQSLAQIGGSMSTGLDVGVGHVTFTH